MNLHASALVRLSSLSLLLSLTGCSLLIDTTPYLSDSPGVDAGPGADANVDANVDAAVDPDAPSSPTIAIDPAAPSTLDDLQVQIQTASEDPLSADAPTYEYAWSRDGASASIALDTVSSTETAKHEVWQVSVTPVSADGMRRGPAATAEVTIVNSPAHLAYVGLSDYRPIAGDTLRAETGPTWDDDGDSVLVDYVWYVNDVVVDGQRNNELALDQIVVAPGDGIRVEATPRDDEASFQMVSAGPARMLEDITRWRQILPERVFSRAHFVSYDAQHGRFIFGYGTDEDFGGVRVWQFVPGPGAGRFTQLHPTGPEPKLIGGVPIYDVFNERILIVGAQGDVDSGDFNSNVYALSVDTPGQEVWTTLSTSGELPPPRLFTSVAYDSEREQVLMFGGMDPREGDGTAYRDLWSLDVSTAGAEAWTQLDVMLPPDALIGSGFVVDEDRHRALLISGGEFGTGGGGAPIPDASIYTLDLENMEAGFVRASTSLGQAVLLPTVGIDRENDRVLIAHGILGDDGSFPSIQALDLETFDNDVLNIDGAPTSGGRGLLVEDEYSDEPTMLFYPGAPTPDSAGEFDIYALNLIDDTLEAEHETGVDLPRPLTQAAASSGMTLFGGRDSEGDYHDEVWNIGTGSRWLRTTTNVDVVTGNRPSGRAGFSLHSNSPYDSNIQFFSGRGAGGLEDGQAWVLRDSTWVEQTLRSGEVMPSSREGAVTYRPGCGGSQFGYFGGQNATDAVLDDAAFLDCNGDRECRWSDPVMDGGIRPPARAWAAGGHVGTDSRIVIYGGRDNSNNVLGDVWQLNTCGGGGEAWEEVLPTVAAGVDPGARWGHSMTLISDEGGGALPTFVVIGGARQSNGVELADAYRLIRYGMADYRWEQISVAAGPFDDQISPRYHHATVFDRRSLRFLVYGGTNLGRAMGDLWELRLR